MMGDAVAVRTSGCLPARAGIARHRLPSPDIAS
jgi:hypothetical protein